MGKIRRGIRKIPLVVLTPTYTTFSRSFTRKGVAFRLLLFLILMMRGNAYH